jgi:hypothetical protein
VSIISLAALEKYCSKLKRKKRSLRHDRFAILPFMFNGREGMSTTRSSGSNLAPTSTRAGGEPPKGELDKAIKEEFWIIREN